MPKSHPPTEHARKRVLSGNAHRAVEQRRPLSFFYHETPIDRQLASPDLIEQIKQGRVGARLVDRESGWPDTGDELRIAVEQACRVGDPKVIKRVLNQHADL